MTSHEAGGNSGYLDGLRQRLDSDQEMTEVAESVAELFSKADPEALQAALEASQETGDMSGVAELLGIEEVQLISLIERGQAAANVYADDIEGLRALNSEQSTTEETSS